MITNLRMDLPFRALLLTRQVQLGHGLGDGVEDGEHAAVQPVQLHPLRHKRPQHEGLNRSIALISKFTFSHRYEHNRTYKGVTPKINI